MDKLELMKTANEIRKGVITAVHSAKSGASGRIFQRLTFTIIYILKR